jgi:hypothetical protein
MTGRRTEDHEMRRPLSSELNAEDRLLAQRWAIAFAAIYSTIGVVIVAAMLATAHFSTTGKIAVAARPEQNDSSQDRSGTRPDRLSRNVALHADRAAGQPYVALKTTGTGDTQ